MWSRSITSQSAYQTVMYWILSLIHFLYCRCNSYSKRNYNFKRAYYSLYFWPRALECGTNIVGGALKAARANLCCHVGPLWLHFLKSQTCTVMYCHVHKVDVLNYHHIIFDFTRMSNTCFLFVLFIFLEAIKFKEWTNVKDAYWYQ